MNIIYLLKLTFDIILLSKYPFKLSIDHISFETDIYEE